jgi:hypothetical protein
MSQRSLHDAQVASAFPKFRGEMVAKRVGSDASSNPSKFNKRAESVLGVAGGEPATMRSEDGTGGNACLLEVIAQQSGNVMRKEHLLNASGLSVCGCCTGVEVEMFNVERECSSQTHPATQQQPEQNAIASTDVALLRFHVEDVLESPDLLIGERDRNGWIDAGGTENTRGGATDRSRLFEMSEKLANDAANAIQRANGSGTFASRSAPLHASGGGQELREDRRADPFHRAVAAVPVGESAELPTIDVDGGCAPPVRTELVEESGERRGEIHLIVLQ